MKVFYLIQCHFCIILCCYIEQFFISSCKSNRYCYDVWSFEIKVSMFTYF